MITISAKVLEGLELGNYKITILTTDGNQPTVLLSVIDSNAETQKKSVIDNFESYADDAELAAAYHRNSSGDSLTVSLDAEHAKNGSYAMKYEYSVADGGAGYCGTTKKLNGADWTGFDGIHFWILSDGSNRDTTIQFIDGAGAYWESIQHVTAETGWQEVKIPFSDFRLQQWGTAAETPTLNGVSEYSIYTGQNGNPGTGVWYFDDIGLYQDGATVPDAEVVESSATFSKQAPADVIFTIITNGHAVTGITEEGEALQQGVDFAINGSQFRFNQSYLETLSEGVHTYHVGFATCPDLVLTITVTGSTVTTTETTTEPSETTTTTTTTEITSTETEVTTGSESETTTTTTDADTDTNYGDVNLDGKVDLVDAITMNKYLAGQITLSEQATKNADVNADGSLGDGDSTTLMQFVLMMIPNLPA